MTRYTFGTALRAATLAAAIGALASPAFAQQQPGTGGGAGGESGSSKATDMNKGAPPTNPTAGSGGAPAANTGINQNTGGGSSPAGTGGGAGGDSGSGATTDRQTGTQRGDPAAPAK